MTVDNLSRSTVFSGTYRNEVARLVQQRRLPDGSYKISDAQLKSIETAARRTALKDTRNLLYDLAERTRFGDMVGVMMPFYNAWQEVITRWSGQLCKILCSWQEGYVISRQLKAKMTMGIHSL